MKGSSRVQGQSYPHQVTGRHYSSVLWAPVSNLTYMQLVTREKRSKGKEMRDSNLVKT